MIFDIVIVPTIGVPFFFLPDALDETLNAKCDTLELITVSLHYQLTYTEFAQPDQYTGQTIHKPHT
jgi:hypothetical protein